MSLSNKLPIPDMKNIEHNDDAEAKNVVMLGKTSGGAYVPIKVDTDGSIMANYLKLDGSNANQNIDIGIYGFTATTLNADHIAEKTPGHNVVFDDIIEGTTIGARTFTGNNLARIQLITVGVSPAGGAINPFGGAMDLGANYAPLNEAFRNLYLTGDAFIDTMTLSSGSITDSSGTISFGDEHLTTTGTAGIGTAPIVNTALTVLGGTERGFRLNQGADDKGFRIYGFDDRDTSYFDIRIDGAGQPILNAPVGWGFSTNNALWMFGASTSITFYEDLRPRYATVKYKYGDLGAKGYFNFDGTDLVWTASSSHEFKLSGYSAFTQGDATNYTEIKADGEINLIGTARVLRHLRIGAGSLKLGASSPTAGLTGVFPHLAFSHTVNQEAHYQVLVPHRWDSSTDIEICFDWLYTGGQDNGTVKWGLEYNSKAEGEDPTSGSVTISNASPGNHTTGELVRTCLTAKILASNLTAEDVFGMRLFRDQANDTLGTSAILLGIHFHLIQNKLGGAT